MQNWYLAKISFRIICGDGNHKPQFDEQLRLVYANGKAEALEKAENLGRKEQDMFLNQQQQLVQWNYITVSELFKISELMDGAEIYSRIEEMDHPDAHVDNLLRKADQLRFGNSHELLHLA